MLPITENEGWFAANLSTITNKWRTWSSATSHANVSGNVRYTLTPQNYDCRPVFQRLLQVPPPKMSSKRGTSGISSAIFSQAEDLSCHPPNSVEALHKTVAVEGNIPVLAHRIFNR